MKIRNVIKFKLHYLYTKWFSKGITLNRCRHFCKRCEFKSFCTNEYDYFRSNYKKFCSNRLELLAWEYHFKNKK